MTPSKKEIVSVLTNYNFALKILENILEAIEKKNKTINRWHIFSEKLGRKFLIQGLTLQLLFKDDVYYIKNDTEEKFFDFSSIYSLLRVQMETYTTFHHLFVDKCSMEEKIIRFRLWELDGLRTVESYDKRGNEFEDERIKLNNDIENCITTLQSFNFYKKLDTKIQKHLIDYTNWKFTSESLKNKEPKKWKLTMDQLIMKTGVSEKMFNDYYKFTSTHAHSSYWSVIQNDTLKVEDKFTMEYTSIMTAVFITCFIIKDFAKIYDTANDVLSSLTPNENEVIESFNIHGKK